MLLWVLIIGGLLLLLVQLFPEIHVDGTMWVQLVYMVALLVFLGGGIFRHYSNKSSKMLRDLSIWVAIFLGLMLAYGFRENFGEVGKVLMGQFTPSAPIVTDEGLIELRMASDGHFYVNAEVNGQPVRFLVDTGATQVMLTSRDAKRVGYDLDRLEYNQLFHTANGKVRGASIKIRSIRIANLELKNISASVNSGDTDNSLLGMSFLDQLSGYSVRGDVMVLEP